MNDDTKTTDNPEDDEDIVLAELSDEELKEQLWEEYRKYKRSQR